MGGYSSSLAQSEQDAYQSITQQYMGTCDFSCTNNMSNVTIVSEDSTINGIDISQACNVDGNCLLSSTTDANASVFFSAQNSTSASDAGGWLNPLNVDISSSSSYQDMRQQISQAVQQKASFSTTNNMDNIVIYTARSTIGGTGIEISQDGSTSGSATLTNMMQGMANATGMTTNDAQSGKKAMNISQWMELAGIALGVIIIIVIVVGVVHYFVASSKTPPTKPSTASAPASGIVAREILEGGGENIIFYSPQFVVPNETPSSREGKRRVIPQIAKGFPPEPPMKNPEAYAEDPDRLRDTLLGREVLSKLKKSEKSPTITPIPSTTGSIEEAKAASGVLKRVEKSSGVSVR